MKVKELIEHLSKIENQESEVVCFNVHSGLFNALRVVEDKQENQTVIIEQYRK